MGAIHVLQEKLEDGLGFIHAKRREALWRLVGGLLLGQELWLTELGRNLPGECSIKHRVKAVDRFLASPIQAEIPRTYAALAAFLLRAVRRPVVLVDWCGAGRGLYVLTATVAFPGRALPILSRTYPEKKKATPKVEKAFLEELKTVLPAHCHPVLVTDAGFLFKWVDGVRQLGWDYVARVRFKKMNVQVGCRSMKLYEVYGLAKRKPRDLGTIGLGTVNRREHRAVLSTRPRRKGRRSLNLKGEPRANGVARVCEAQAREPLLLITSLSESPRLVVDIYRKRMQIEQTFRDLKSHRYGWSSRHIRSSQPRRVDVLLLIAAIAVVVMHVIGLAVRDSDLARGFQANTERERTVFSTFFLGRLVVKACAAKSISLQMLRAALVELRSKLAAVERIPA